MTGRTATVVRSGLAAVGVLVGCAASLGIAGADPPPPAPGPAPGPAPKAVIDHDGTFKVGSDIAAGTYSSAGPIAGKTCYWKRVGGPSGTETVDNAISKKAQVVQIDPGDKVFKTDGCQPWQLTDPANAPPDVSPSAAEAQLRGNLNDLNGRAGQAGVPPLPGP
jgi:hypothetical protein